MRALPAAALALLAGCAVPTIEDMRAAPAAMTASLPAAPQTAASCLARAWEARRMERGGPGFRTTMRADGAHASVVIDSPGMTTPVWLIDLTAESSSGASAQAFPMPGLNTTAAWLLGQHMAAAVDQCAGRVSSNRLLEPISQSNKP